MSKRDLLRYSIVALGALSFAGLTWFGGPLISVGEVRPFDNIWVRSGLVLGIIICAALAVIWDILRHRKDSAALAEALTGAKEEDDAGVLRDSMKSAIATLRATSKGGGDPIYELPWYIFIGPPGTGKTTALINSGLKFPLTKGGAPQAVAGVAGTRYCDWWFTEDAIFLDTAGRYTLQDSDPKSDKASWLALLDLLRRHRGRQPINGVLVAISVEDLLCASPEEIEEHAMAIRRRLAELHDRLKISFPVYALLTKTDMVAGFVEFFGDLRETERAQVWGHTFQTVDRRRNMISDIPAEFDALVQRLNEQMPDKLQGEPNSAARAALIGFPSQFAALKQPVIEFLSRVFEPSRYDVNATLRGFYLTSGTQQGTPIDRLIGALSQKFGAESAPLVAYSGRGKSYFIADVLNKVAIPEAGWVSTNRQAVRRGTVMRGMAFASLGLAGLVMLALWFVSYKVNRELVLASDRGAVEYRSLAAPLLREVTVSDRNLAQVLPLLHKLRHLPAGYASRQESEPLSGSFGLSQRERLRSASEVAYQRALERFFRSRLIFRLEEVLESRMRDPAVIYETLKAYLMIGGRAPPDRDFLLSFMRTDWSQNLFPGAGNARGRQGLEEHLVAMLDLEVGREPVFTLNQTLIEDAQRTLARLSIAERAYELLKSQARGASERDWIVGQRGGADVALVFQGANGEDLDSIRVPYFFTYEGFHSAFLDRLTSIGGVVESERWLLGPAGQQSAIERQFASLYPDLLRLYGRDFVSTWNAALRRLKLRPLTADKPRYVALSAAAASTTPIRQLIESVREETRLTRERSTKSAASPAANKPLAGAAGAFFSSGEAPGSSIEAQFRAFQLAVDGEGGKRPIDALVHALSEVNQKLLMAAADPSQQAALHQTLVPNTSALRAMATRFPPPFDKMIQEAASEFEGDAAGATLVNLQQGLADQVTRICHQIVTNRYPFFRASDRDVGLADFGRLFSPGGIIDKFFAQNLAAYVDQSRSPWSWKPDSRIGKSLSPVSLRQFQQASEIRDTFFGGGGVMPSLNLMITPITLSADAGGAKLEVNGVPVSAQQGASAPTQVPWPGPVPRSAITITAGGGFFGGGLFSQPTTVQKEGAWSFFRLLDLGSALPQGDAVQASFVVGGKQVSYRIHASTSQHPLTMPSLREFRCPSGL